MLASVNKTGEIGGGCRVAGTSRSIVPKFGDCSKEMGEFSSVTSVME
jgi:hypothetical protein